MSEQPNAPARKSNSSKLVLITVLFTVLGACALVCGGCTLLIVSTSQRTPSHLEEHTIEGGSSTKKVMVIPIYGTIGMPEAFGPAGTSVAAIRDQVEKALNSDSVVAVLLDVDSPGGTVYASDEIHNLLAKLKGKKKMFAHFRSMAASGGYYVSCGADKIFADPTCLTGSISVKSEIINVEGLLNMIGVKVDVLKSGEFKDIMSPYRSMTEQERALMQVNIDIMYQRFVDVVAKGRGKTEEEVRAFADGRIFMPDEAMKLGLIDAIGYRDFVYSELRKTLGDCSFVEYSQPKTFLDYVMGEAREPSLETRISSILSLHGTRLMMYMMK